MYTMEHKVHLSDTDTTGQVYYSRPLEWLEWCRVNWFESKFGNFLKYVEDTGITFFPAKVNVEYKRPILFGDNVKIEMQVAELKKVSALLDYTVKRNDEIVLKSQITMVCFNTKSKRLSSMNDELQKAFQEM